MSYRLPLALLSATVLLGACSKPEPVQEPVRSVKLVKVGTVGALSDLEYAAEVRARVESRLGFRVGGQLTQRLVDVGQVVKAGQVLATIDPRDYQLVAQAAAAAVQAAQTQKDLAAADLKRFEALRDQGFVSGAEIERRQATLRAAEATLTQAQAQAGIQGNQAAYTQLVSDAAGVVVAIDADVGQVVAPGTPVVRVARQGPRDVVLSVPEDRIGLVRVGQTAQVSLWSGGVATPAPLAAQVREVAASADPATRTFIVKVALPQNQTAPLGATAKVRLLSNPASNPAAQAVALPAMAVWKNGADSAVWVFDAASTTVKARAVQVVGIEGDRVLIASGLQSGEEVVAAGAHVLTEGQVVTRFESSQR